ncbi:MAG: DJ-1/PfpI family protein [Atopobiaceae bacterium]|jgi:putative intracellular protease/amidase|nr:DJ-1/PfpI family protein [Atopobiaceae bacterium]MCI2173039.1 DJ-1/PfpI family protein [Atopobiaceae bacterium]MCI2208132.1 DJ-1/PfpI family protein [Atopobiaceae bacterium]
MSLSIPSHYDVWRIAVHTLLLLILEPFSDWEAAPLAAAVNKEEGWQVRVVSNGHGMVRSIGGFRVEPDMGIDEAMGLEFDGLALIGGNSWRDPAAASVLPLVNVAIERGAVLGAICGATVFLGANGILNTAEHTSNDLADLSDYAGDAYTGADRYHMEQSVRDGRLVTANGSAPFEFARDVMLALGFDADEVSGWYAFYHLGYCEAHSRGLV